jgi:hypothetical protein
MGPTKPGPSPKLVLIAAGLALLVLLGGGGLAYALTRDNGGTNPNGLGQQTTDAATPTVTATAPAVPADEQCTDAIKANTRWVCLTKATMSNSELRIEYQFANGGTAFNISNGFHVHIYGSNADGTDPADSRMGSHASNPGSWYVEDKQPSVHASGTSQYNTVGNKPKVCARIAKNGHQLVPDANGTYKTGNCVPVTRV